MKSHVLCCFAIVGLAAMSSASENDFAATISAKYDRVALAHLPTPLEAMKSLTEELGGPPLYIKRDDQTGLAFGGNKARKLEFIFADVLNKKSDIIITWAGIQSNWARQTAAAALLYDIEPILVLEKAKQSPSHGGNILLDRLMGADVRLVESGVDRPEYARVLAKELREQGHNPYVVPVGGSSPLDSMELPLGAIAYANGFNELWEQSRAQGWEFDHVVLANGSGGTQAGLMVGARAVAPHVKIVGVSVDGEEHRKRTTVTAIANETARALGLTEHFAEDETIIVHDYVGEGYGIVDASIANALATFARHEAVMLDPVYTGKAAAGLIDLVNEDYFEGSRGVVFLHTGGTPALFAYEEDLLKHIN
jgi:D-cysteine desulfhydrase family pyridoxal phosphate-dependent enzyme